MISFDRDLVGLKLAITQKTGHFQVKHVLKIMALFNLIDHVHMLLRKLRIWVPSSVIDYCLTRT